MCTRYYINASFNFRLCYFISGYFLSQEIESNNQRAFTQIYISDWKIKIHKISVFILTIFIKGFHDQISLKAFTVLCGIHINGFKFYKFLTIFKWYNYYHGTFMDIININNIKSMFICLYLCTSTWKYQCKKL
jgi:hypothetical protein